MDNRKKTIVVFSVLFTLILLLGGTYAWLKVSVVGDTRQVIHAGKLDLILDDKTSNGIDMENVVPVSEEKGREQEGYTFHLINQGSISSKYTVYLDDLDLEENEVRMKDSAVRYVLERDGVELSSGLLPSIGSNPNRVLDTGVINGKTTYVYKLKVWMDIDATSENMDTVFYAKIRVETEQANIPFKKSELELTPESKEKIPIKDGENSRDYTYTSSDWDVVKVDEEGNIEVVGPGYAIVTKKDQYGGKEEITVHVTVPVEVTYETNDKVVTIGDTKDTSCNLTENKQATCQVSLPEVEVIDGYEFVGWSTEAESHKGEKESANVSRDKPILYPIVKKIGDTHQVTLINQGDGIVSIGSESLSCKAKDTYNNDPINTTCVVTLPEIVAEAGYAVIGWSTDPNATEGITPGSEVEITGNIIYYPIVKKRLTATFKLNGATALDGKASNITRSCEIQTNSRKESLGKCVVEVPVITAPSVTPEVLGFSENKNGTKGQIPPEARTVEIEKDVTYYALTRSGSEAKTLTVTFYRNDAESLGGEDVTAKDVSCNIPISYNGQEQEKSCRITSPSIEAPTNTPRVIGYSTSADNHTSSWNVGEEKEISSNQSFFAQTVNDDEIKYTATYKKGSNVTSVGKSSDSCKVEASYNGDLRGKSCTIIAPTITPKIGYTSVGYSELENDTTGATNLVLTKDTIFYANAVANSYKIEYYSEEEKVEESNAQVGTAITIPTKEALGIEKRGYSFKGWSTSPTATTSVYADGAEVSNLSTIEGAIVKLYAVWVDDIAPVCTFSGMKDSYIVGEKFTLTLTCTDEGSGLADIGEQALNFDSNNFCWDVNNDGACGGIDEDFDFYNVDSTSCEIQNGILTCQVDVEANATPYSKNGTGESNKTGLIRSDRSKAIVDKAGNATGYQSDYANVFGKTFTATMTQDGIEGMSTLESTTQSCTTELDNRSCDVDLGNSITADEHYRWAGWSTDKTASQGSYQFTLEKDTTFYPVVGPILIDAYIYDETKINESDSKIRTCVTGEESTCERTTCYKNTDSGSCPPGTIFKYAVKSTYENRRVDSLNDHVHYFHVIEDKGTILTMQSREDTAVGIWADNVPDGPVTAINILEEATNDWEYMNTQKYTMGETVFGNYSSNTSCDQNTLNCDTPFYKWDERSAKARMITVQEAKNVGCTNKDGDCPVWMFNYLTRSISAGGTNNGTHYDCYWTMNAGPWKNYAMFVYYSRIVQNAHTDTRGIRAVVEITK